MTGLYLLGIVMAVLTARLMRRLLFKVDETPFVMELPPYRIPTVKATLSHMWARCRQYLRKMGGMILVASLVVWFLGYFPRQTEAESVQHQYETSYIGQIGRLCEPVLEPLGLNWKAGVALLSGVAAKEIMVSTMGVLYAEDGAPTVGNEEVQSQESVVPSRLYERLRLSGDFSLASVLALLVFTLLYFPCVATIVAIGSECGWKWAVGLALYSTALAWVCSWAVYNLALWLL
jgi:ferrous iron transport protein B